MNGIVIDVDPVIFRVGSLSVGWYGLAIASAILAGILIAVREGKRKGIAKDDVYLIALWGIAAAVVGARLFHVMENLDYYGSRPGAIFALQQGGLAIWGAIVGGTLAVAIYAKRRGLPLARIADGAVPALLVGQIIGRIGCIVNGDAYGDATSLPWGFIYSHPGSSIPRDLLNVPTHPYPVYEMIWNLSILLLLWTVRKRLKTNGLLFVGYVLLYSVGRFFLTFVRLEKTWFWGIQEAQVIALIAFVASSLMMVYLLRRKGTPTSQKPLTKVHGS